jgi:hypothetical protein
MTGGRGIAVTGGAVVVAFLLVVGSDVGMDARAAVAATPAPTPSRADSLFARHNWKAAAVAYEAIVKADPENGFAWFRLGASRQGAGDYDGAIEAYTKAESIRHNPLAMFHLAAAYAHQKKDDLAFEWLSKAADAGFRWHQVYLDEPDFARLRPDPRFAAIETRIKENSSPCTQRAEARQLDFWLGEWVCRTPTGVIAGKSSIASADRDCVILERWTDPQGETGISFNLYNGVKGQWQQTWMSGSGQVAEFSGEFRDGAMRLTGYREGPNGERIPARLTLTPSGPDTVRQVGENSPDGGVTWNVIYEFIYTRK